MNQAFIYLRVSTDEQKESGRGIDAQERDSINTALALKLEIHQPLFPDEDICSTTPIERRPALSSLLREIGPGDVLVCQDRDRIARDPDLVSEVEKILRKKKAQLVDVHLGVSRDTPEDKVMRRVKDAMAEYEHGMTQRRCLAVSLTLKERNLRWGTVPYGFAVEIVGNGKDAEKRIVPNPGEQKIISIILDLQRAGNGPYAIAKKLNEDGIRTRGSIKCNTIQSGGMWNKSRIKRILQIAHNHNQLHSEL